jgi:hypothetical protein
MRQVFRAVNGSIRLHFHALAATYLEKTALSSAVAEAIAECHAAEAVADIEIRSIQIGTASRLPESTKDTLVADDFGAILLLEFGNFLRLSPAAPTLDST